VANCIELAFSLALNELTLIPTLRASDKLHRCRHARIFTNSFDGYQQRQDSEPSLRPCPRRYFLAAVAEFDAILSGLLPFHISPIHYDLGSLCHALQARINSACSRTKLASFPFQSRCLAAFEVSHHEQRCAHNL